MSSVLVEMQVVKDGPSILIETTASEGAEGFIEAAAIESLPLRAERTLKQALASLAPTAGALLDQLREMSQQPQKVVVEFGIKFGAKGNLIIAGGDAEANCKVTATWESKPQNNGK
jgi:hypothetical protein